MASEFGADRSSRHLDQSRRVPVYEGRIIEVRVEVDLLPDGRKETSEIVTHPSAVCVVPMTTDGHVMLVRQYRKAAEAFLLEAPAGKMEPGEPPDVTAIRELEEEIGHTAGHLKSLGGFFVAPAYCTQFMHSYLATDLRQSSRESDEDEFIEVRRVPLTKIPEWIFDGRIRDGKSIASLLLAMRVMGDN